MAKRVTVELVDDLDDSLAADETVTFALDGVAYEIDLSSVNAEGLRGALASYIAAGTKVSNRRKTGSVPSAGGAGRSKEQVQAVRDWAIANGHQISTRGRIPRTIQALFDAAH